MTKTPVHPGSPPTIGNLRRQPTTVPGAVRVDRANPMWGNPFRLRHQASAHERSECIRRHRRWFLSRCLTGQIAFEDVRRLADATVLLCWCWPLDCHAQTLREAALEAKARGHQRWLQWCRDTLAETEQS